MHLLIFNPVSGRHLNKTQPYFEAKLNEAKIEYDVLITKNENTIDAYLGQSEATYACIIVAGGDGTISQTIDAMIKYDIKAKMLVYPKGTTNEFASAMGLDGHVFERYIEGKGVEESIDIGVYNGLNSFIYSMSFGNYTHITYKTPQQLKNVFGYVAYWMYTVYSLYFLKMKDYEMQVTLDEEVYDGHFFFGGVSNSKTLGTIIHHHDVLFNDGHFEVILIRTPKNIRELRELLHAMVIRKYESKLIVYKKVQNLTFQSNRSHSWNKDGEFAGKLKTLQIRVLSNYLTIIK